MDECSVCQLYVRPRQRVLRRIAQRLITEVTPAQRHCPTLTDGVGQVEFRLALALILVLADRRTMQHGALADPIVVLSGPRGGPWHRCVTEPDHTCFHALAGGTP